MPKWEYMFLVAARLNETWKVALVNGRELPNWKTGLSLYDYMAQKGEEGWEIVSASFAPIFTQTGFVESEDYRLVLKRQKG